MKNSFFNSFVPKQPNFFCLLKQLADILSEAADVLTESVEQGKPEERETYYRRVKEVERKGDMVTHQLLGRTAVQRDAALPPECRLHPASCRRTC